MKKKYLAISFLVLCLAATLFIGVTSIGEVKTQVTPVVYLDPPSVTSKVCQNFTVDIRIRDLEAASHLNGWAVRLGYHNMTLEALDCEEGPFMIGFQNPNGTFFIYLLYQESGYVQVSGVILGLPDGDHDGTPGEEEDWPNGTGVLATVTFHCTKGGECVLDLYDTRLIDGDNFLIPHQVEDGYILVPRVDLNDDGEVNIIDIVIVGLAFGAKRIDNPEDPRYGEYWHEPPCPNCPH